MIENTLENKAKFFALYCGQDVIHHPEMWPATFEDVITDGEEWIENAYLELLPLLSITNEDLKDLAAFIYEPELINDGRLRDIHAWIKYSILNEVVSAWEMEFVNDLTKDDEMLVVDFLRSRGYLLPYMGLTPDEIINYKWAKYKEV